MKRKNFIKICFAFIAAFVLIGCNNNDEPATPPAPEVDPTVAIEMTGFTESRIGVVITSDNAEKVAYVCVESGEDIPTNEAIIADGTAVEPNKEVVFDIDGLNSGTEYVVVACAQQGDKYVSQQCKGSTLAGAVWVDIANDIETTVTSITFKVMSGNATSVYYLCKPYNGEESSANSEDEIVANGTAVEPNKEVSITVENLQPSTSYSIAVLALGADESYTSMSTVADTLEGPSVLATATDDIGADYFVFNVTSANAEEVKYVCIEAGSRDITADQVMKNGTAVEANSANVAVKVENLKEEIAYEVYVAASGSGVVVMAEKLAFTTIKSVVEYVVVPDAASSTINAAGNNFYATFTDSANGYQLKLDLYTAESHKYLPSGEYKLKSETPDHYIGMSYTALVIDGSQLKQFATGVVTVEATPNEETREIHYVVTAALTSEDGGYMAELHYEGMIDGLVLPEEVPDAPEGAYVFTPNEANTSRLEVNGEVAGEYYIKFIDDKWNEFALDIKVDPAICNDGKDALPEGTYSIENGGIDPYTYITIYNTPISGNFKSAELTVKRDGLVYTFTFLGTIEKGNVIFMHWTGEVKNMERL